MTIRTCKNKPDSIRCYKNCGSVKSSYIYLIEERLLKIVLEELKKTKYEFEFIEDKIHNHTELNALKIAIDANTKQLSTLDQQKNKLYDLLEQGIYNNNIFLDRMRSLSLKINSIDRNIEDLQAKLSIINTNEYLEKNTIPWINNTIESIKNIYWNLDVKQRNEFLKTIIDKVIYKKDKKAGKDGFELEVYLIKYM